MRFCKFITPGMASMTGYNVFQTHIFAFFEAQISRNRFTAKCPDKTDRYNIPCSSAVPHDLDKLFTCYRSFLDFQPMLAHIPFVHVSIKIPDIHFTFYTLNINPVMSCSHCTHFSQFRNINRTTLAGQRIIFCAEMPTKGVMKRINSIVGK